jgi:hypothetical protein
MRNKKISFQKKSHFLFFAYAVGTEKSCTVGRLDDWTIGRLGLRTCEIIVNSLYCVQL